MCVLISSETLSEKFLILRRTERDMIKMFIGLLVKYPLFLSDFNETWIVSRFSKTAKISNLMKIRPVAAKMFHANRQTDRHEQANSRFSQFCEAPKNES